MLRDLYAAGVARIALGQYLRPTRYHLPVKEYISPANRHKAGLTGWGLSPACCYGHLYSPYYAECGVFTVSDSLKMLSNIELNLCLQL